MPGLVRGNEQSAIIRPMKPLSGSASLAETNWFNLIGAGEVVPRLGRVVADRRHQHVIQAGDNFTDRNQLGPFTLHALFSHLPQTPQGWTRFSNQRLASHLFEFGYHRPLCLQQIPLRRQASRYLR